MSVVDWASKNPYKTGGIVFGVGVLIVIIVASSAKPKQAPVEETNVQLSLGPSAQETQAAMELASIQNQTSAAVSVANTAASVRLAEIASGEKVSLASIGYATSKSMFDTEVAKLGINRAADNADLEYRIKDNVNARDFYLTLNASNFDFAKFENQSIRDYYLQADKQAKDNAIQQWILAQDGTSSYTSEDAAGNKSTIQGRRA